VKCISPCSFPWRYTDVLKVRNGVVGIRNSNKNRRRGKKTEVEVERGFCVKIPERTVRRACNKIREIIRELELGPRHFLRLYFFESWRFPTFMLLLSLRMVISLCVTSTGESPHLASLPLHTSRPFSLLTNTLTNSVPSHDETITDHKCSDCFLLHQLGP
jgi:hypothetical protein